MCGIIGILSSNEVKSVILYGLQQLQNRGYDSVGVCGIKNAQFQSVKSASLPNISGLERVKTSVNEMSFGNVGMGHTRWATHGKKTDKNSHPHFDNRNRIAVVHNGIIENYLELKTELLESGYEFYSETDTEVIAVLIGMYVDRGMKIPQAIYTSLQRLHGTWALIVLDCQDASSMWISRHGSPLLIGYQEDSVIVVSERSAFPSTIQNYKFLEDDTCRLLHVERQGPVFSIRSLPDALELDPKLFDRLQSEIQDNQNTSHPYPHWMIKEIWEQSETVLRAINYGGRINENGIYLGGLSEISSRLRNIRHLVILGCGTSYHAGLFGSNFLKEWNHFNTVQCLDAGEFHLRDLPKDTEDSIACLVLSQSGETRDIIRILQSLPSNICKLGIVNVVGSQIARMVDAGVHLNAGREVAVASTKSFLSQCIVMSLLSSWWNQSKSSQLYSYITTFHTRLQNHMSHLKSHVQTIHEAIGTHKNFFVMGYAEHLSICREICLKLKEICYLYAEPYSITSLKHGPLALITEGTPVLLLDHRDYHDKVMNCYNELTSRGSDVVLLRDGDSPLDCLLHLVSIQAYCYEYAVRQNWNPDFPKNLAKVVTVE